MRRSKASPIHRTRPNPAKAPWYFLGLQEMLHYFPPVVAGVLVPGLVVMALIVIPYFNVNIEADGLFLKDRTAAAWPFLCCRRCALDFPLCFRGLRRAGADADHGWASCCGSAQFSAVAFGLPPISGREAAFLLDHDVVLIELVVLTAIGTFFRGPGWSWVLPWRMLKCAYERKTLRRCGRQLFGDTVRAFGVVSLFCCCSRWRSRPPRITSASGATISTATWG